MSAWSTPSTEGEQRIESETVTACGSDVFTDLDQASGGRRRTSTKLEARDGLAREEGQYSRMTRWYGDGQSFSAASPAPVTAAGANISLPLAGGISGTVTSAARSTDGVYVQIVDAVDGW